MTNVQALVPLLAGQVERIEIEVSDAELVELGREHLQSYQALLDAAIAYGLDVVTWRDYSRNCAVATICRPVEGICPA